MNVVSSAAASRSSTGRPPRTAAAARNPAPSTQNITGHSHMARPDGVGADGEGDDADHHVEQAGEQRERIESTPVHAWPRHFDADLTHADFEVHLERGVLATESLDEVGLHPGVLLAVDPDGAEPSAGVDHDADVAWHDHRELADALAHVESLILELRRRQVAQVDHHVADAEFVLVEQLVVVAVADAGGER